ncbi:hypothetical protein F5B22DRAFT_281985 [Xylaria bambusicola]|uniref:uncharacterized protein n=1 Tax=Xylaria bambusicola TaxID=326684 RepID=UPI0020089DCA|nr:uncharacterized protein F5B22DRAFT_281985 [Xylaria bambusicola]KAI0512969.1 hypothetical protein F5B22DRAFT_281985 [Xylaria bambusicola]
MTGQKPVTIVAIGTLDTKLVEYLYLRSQILEADPSINVILIDAGRAAIQHEAITVSQPEVLKASSASDGSLESLPRGEVVATMIDGAKRVIGDLVNEGKVHGVIALGGSGGTSIAAATMRELPLTLPKLIVSTVASGDTSSYVAESDITMMYSVVDIAGLNDVLRAVITNAAVAIAGMARGYAVRCATPTGSEVRKKCVAVTMFGVTTPAVTVARQRLEEMGFEVYVFHATGAGGRSMERLLREGRLDGVLDLTTTELADELVGGVMSANEERLTIAAKTGVPQIVSVGALDMVNFGPKDTVPEKFRDRKFFEHNPSVTLMRTTSNECRELGKRIASRLRANCVDASAIEVWLPLKGISAIAVQGQAFYDNEADGALFDAIKAGLDGSGIAVKEVDADINDPKWAESIARRLVELVNSKSKG